ncbi:MAG: hypothetical protein U0228_07055 [Myxococcaceae bacterium]
MPRPPVLLLFASLLTACPSRTPPERGVMLIISKPEGRTDEVRATLDRRLAHLKLKAKLGEDGDTFSIRVAADADLELIKKLVTTRGELRFCREATQTAKAWCELGRRDGLSALGDESCGVQGRTRDAVLAVLQPWADGGIAWETQADRTVVAWAADEDCRTPRITAAEVVEGQPALNVTFDRASADDFAKLTQKVLGQHLLIELDGEVQSAPVVQSAITGGRAMLMVGPSHQSELEVLGAVLAGGPLPALTVTKVQPYGPPSLTR